VMLAEDPNASLEQLLVTPFDDETLRYSLGLFSEWQRAEELGEFLDLPTVQRPIGAFGSGGPPEGQSMTVTLTPMAIEIRMEDWVRQVFERSQWTVLDQRWHENEGDPRLVTWGTRKNVVKGTVAFADGGRVFMIHCMGAARRQAAVATTLWHCAMSLRLERPAGPGALEGRVELGCGEHGFQLPLSWDTRSEFIGTHAATTDAALLDPRRLPSPTALRMRIGGSPELPLQTRREASLARLRKAGWALARQLTEPDAPWRGRPARWQIIELQARTKAGDPVKLRIAHGDHEGLAAEVLVTGHEQRPRCWMRALRALEIAAESLGPRPPDLER